MSLDVERKHLLILLLAELLIMEAHLSKITDTNMEKED